MQTFANWLPLAVGTALDAAFGPYRGKQTGELSLFRQLHDRLGAGDILLADRHFCSFWELALVRERGGDAVTRLHQHRKADFRRGRRLGCCDRVVTWAKEEAWESIGVALRVASREHRVCDRPGRVEPRAQKRPPQHYPLLTEPRAQARSRLIQGRYA